jgi:hypothetical protein
MLKYRHPWLAFILDYWPATVFLPSVLLLVAVLALITRWWDRRDVAAAQEQVALRTDYHVEPISLFDAGSSSDRVTAA